ncbi:MAG: hypothetical protein P8Y63_14040 [Deltaproteobacteria bacterium]|jgi:hypothetical protein
MKRTSNETSEGRGAKTFLWIMSGIGGAIGLWALVAVGFGMASVGSPTELLRHYMVAIGMMKDFETWVDFYTHIKGVEYILSVAFLALFPVYYKYVDRKRAPAGN